MKRLFRLFLLTSIACTIFHFHSNAQANAVIIGPSSLCFGECATYEVVLADSTDFIIFSTWDLNNGVTLSGNPITICMDNPNGMAMVVSGFTEFQQDFQTEMFVEATTAVDPRIVSTSAQCPDSLAACDRICAFNSATYEVTNIPPGQSVTWQVLGAQSFVPDGNSVTVDWGAPGQGEVSVVVGGGSPSNAPLQVFCGQATQNFNTNGIDDGFVEITGGQGPYEITLVTPTGDIVIYTSAGSITFPDLDPGSYSVQVTGADGETVNCDFFINPFVTSCWISGYPSLEVPPSNCNACDGTIVLVSLVGGSGPPIQYSIDGGLSYSSSPVFSNVCPGTYPIIINNPMLGCSYTADFIVPCLDTVFNCSGETSLCVEILEEPKAQIAATPQVVSGVIEICQGQTVYFDNKSENAASYIWEFGDLKTSTQFEPSHTYQIPGTYDVSLIARNACYCNDTTYVQVNVLPADVPEVSCIGTVCEGESVTYSTDAVCGTYDWDITGGGTVLGGGGPGDNFVTVEWLTGPEGYGLVGSEWLCWKCLHHPE